MTSPPIEQQPEDDMVHVAVPMEAALLPPNVSPWIRWLAEPRTISTIRGVMHALMAIAGVCAILIPDEHYFNRVLGSASADTWGILLVIGGALGVAGALPGWWYIERPALVLESIGLALWITALWVAGMEPASMLGFRTCIAAGLILSCSIRWLRISGAGLDPRRGRTGYHS